MLKLIKYELRKKLIPYLIMFIVVIATEIYALSGILSQDKEKTALAFVLFTLIGSFGMIYVFILAVDSYYKEINSKYSFMTFMTPSSSYKIVGSKILTTIVIAVLASAIFIGSFVLDVKLFLDKFDKVASFYDFMDDMFGTVGISISDIIVSFLVMMVTIWFSLVSTICFAYMSITLSFTALANKKGKVIVSIIIFILFFIVNNKIQDLFPVFDYGSSFLMQMIGCWPEIIYDVVVMVACFLVSGYLLEKKVSL